MKFSILEPKMSLVRENLPLKFPLYCVMKNELNRSENSFIVKVEAELELIISETETLNLLSITQQYKMGNFQFQCSVS